jgi:hypothetical protein
MKIKSPSGKEFTFKVGADPEFFVMKDGKPVSAYGLIPGTKEAPYVVPKGAVQVDGMALEFNILPSSSFTEFDNNMTSVMQSLMSMIPGYEVFAEQVCLAGQTITLPSSVAHFGEAYIESQCDEAKELGCMPDFDAYTGEANPRPKGSTPFRTASGHVHIGWRDKFVDPNDPGHFEACRTLAKALDIYLGMISLTWDRDKTRRQLYGKAGAFRPKPYGMEYRVLSNAWITDATLRKLVYHNTLEAVKACFENPEIGNKTFAGFTAQQVINDQPEGWTEAIGWAVEYEGVKSRKFYREN